MFDFLIFWPSFKNCTLDWNSIVFFLSKLKPKEVRCLDGTYLCIKTSNKEDSLDTPFLSSFSPPLPSPDQENPQPSAQWWRCQSVINVSLCPGPGNLAWPATATIIAQTQPPAAYITSTNTLCSILLNTLYTSIEHNTLYTSVTSIHNDED